MLPKGVLHIGNAILFFGTVGWVILGIIMAIK